MVAFAFIQYSTTEEAACATQGVFMLLGSRLRVQQKENFNVNLNRSGPASRLARPMANQFTPADRAIEMTATNLQGAGVVSCSISPTAIHNSQFFIRHIPPVAPGTYDQYPFYPPPNLPATAWEYLQHAHILSHTSTYQWPVANSPPDPNDLAFMNSDKLR